MYSTIFACQCVPYVTLSLGPYIMGERGDPPSFQVAIVHQARLTGTQYVPLLLLGRDDMSSSLWSGVVWGRRNI